MLGFCMSCKQKQSIKDRKVYKTKTNKYLAKGTCNECGSKICTTISKDKYEKEKGKF